MVRSLFISSVLALSAVVSAVTPLVGRALVDAEFEHVGTGDVETGDVLENGVQVNDLTVENVLNGLSVLGGRRIREYDIGGGDFGGDFGDHGLGESDYDRGSFELSDGDIDGDIDADFDDIIGDGGDGGDCGGDCGSGCGGGRRRHPRIPHRVGRIGGGCN